MSRALPLAVLVTSAIIIGLAILGEASGAPVWVYLAFTVVGGIAVWGVFQLARYHPQILSDGQAPIFLGEQSAEEATAAMAAEMRAVVGS